MSDFKGADEIDRLPVAAAEARRAAARHGRLSLSTSNQIDGLKGAAAEKLKALEPATEDPSAFTFLRL